MRATPIGNKYNIKKTKPTLVNLTALYVAATRRIEKIHDKNVTKVSSFGINIDFLEKNIRGIRKINPIKYLESNNIIKDEPSSKANFAAFGTIAKNKDDNNTIKIPDISLKFLNRLNKNIPTCE
tara:strand:- start:146 stop:517 length:372 start_codon:yes stop_codon:yes gene_type:complete